MLGSRTLVQLSLALSVEQYLALLLEKQKPRRTYRTKQDPNSPSTSMETCLPGTPVSLTVVLSISMLNTLNE